MSSIQKAPQRSANSRGTADQVTISLSAREARKYHDAVNAGSPYRTIAQTCAILQCSESGLRNIRRNGRLRSYRVRGIGVLFHIDDIEAFVRSGAEGGDA